MATKPDSTRHSAPVPALPAPDADQDLLQLARANCAQRARDRDQHESAAAYEQGFQDLGWAIRHEVNRLQAEAAAAERRAAAEDNLDIV